MGTYVSNVLTKRLTATGTVSAGPCRLLAIYFVADTTGGSCLLYTSPSPRDVEESRMPSSA